jgi:hypothetical protein
MIIPMSSNNHSFIRAMGHYIRFINNRDLAGENIVTACVRSRLILGSPAGVISSLLARMSELDVALPKRSTLALAGDITAARGETPGAFACEVKRTRRNSRPSDLDAGLAQAAKDLCRSLGHPAAYKPLPSSIVIRMIGGVWLNGRNYKQGPTPSSPLHCPSHLSCCSWPGGHGGCP